MHYNGSIMRDSKYPVVREVNPVVKTGRKWSAAEEVASAEMRRKHDDIVGVTAHGRSGLGWTPRQKLWSRLQIAGTIDSTNAESTCRYVHAMGMSLQGKRTTWESVMDRELSWGDMLENKYAIAQFPTV